MNSRFRRTLTGLAFCLPWLAGLSIFTLYPVAASLYYAFCDYSVLQPPVWTGTENFQHLAHDELFWISLKNTFIYAGFSLPMGMIVALSLALLLNCEVRGTPIFRTIFYLPSIVPVVASSMLWLWIFNPSLGLLNSALAPICHFFGTQTPGWLTDPSWSKPALILMSVWGVGNSMIIYLAGLKDVPEALYESAEIDGANKWQQFWHVTVPMIMPVLYFNLVMGIIGSLQVFTQVFIMTGGTDGSPAYSTLMYAPYLFATAFFDLRMGYASAMAWVLFCIIAVLTIFATRVLQKRIHYTPVKTHSITARLIVYVLLLAGSAIFLAPLAWMLSTSLKPIDQTMTITPIWLPKSFTAVIDGQRTEVTKNSENSPGIWHVTEVSPTNVRSQPPATADVPASDITTTIAPRWSNYPNALASMGGANYDVDSAKTESGAAPNRDSDVSFWVFLGNTLFVCILSVIGAVLSNAVVAYGFSRIEWPGRNWLFGLTLATMMIPGPVLMVPLYGIFRDLGWIGSLQPLWVPHFFANAFSIFLMRQFFLTIPEELSEAARIDGCSEWAIFWRVILPLSKPVLAVVALFTFLGSWNDFMGPLLYLTRKHTFTLALALQSFQSRHNGVQWNYLMAASTVVILPIVVLFFLTQKTFIRGIATTGLKG